MTVFTLRKGRLLFNVGAGLWRFLATLGEACQKKPAGAGTATIGIGPSQKTS
jgi:hypothetical protein